MSWTFINGIPVANSRGAVWNPLKPLGGETPSFWVKENSRSGLTLTDSVNVANNISILPSYFDRNASSGSVRLKVADNGGLDIGGTDDFTIFAKVKNNNTTKAAIKTLLCKGSGANLYYIWMAATTGFLTASCYDNTTTAYIMTSNVDFTDGLWHTVRLQVNQAAKIIKFFVDNVQQGGDKSFAGKVFAANPIGELFNIGQRDDNSTPANFTATSDVMVFHRLWTDPEAVSAESGIYPSDAYEHFPLVGGNTQFEYGVKGRFNLTATNGVATDIGYGVNGSKYLLDNGWTLWKKLVTPTEYKEKVPYGAVTTDLAAAGFNLKETHSGDLLNYNLAEAMLVFVEAGWDRSDTTIYSANARASTTKYIAATPKAWHPSELDYSVMRFFANDGYKGKCFPKISDTSTYDRKTLKEIISYATDKTSADLKKVLTYTNDIGGYHEITYEFETDHICTQRNNKTLYFLSGRYLKLSLDYGSSYVNTIDLNGITNIITFARIYPNGNIVFASHTKVYYSTDNLATYAESTVTGIDGNPFVPTTYTNFRALNYHEDVTIGGQFIDVWGTYSTEVGTVDDNINIWETTDYGVNIKSVWKRNTTLPALTVRHIHSAAYNPTDSSFWFISGDVLGDCHWIKGVRNMGTGAWTFTDVLNNIPNTPQQSISHWFEGDYAYWASEFHGLFRCLYTDIADTTKHEKLTRTENFVSVYDDGNVLTCCYVNVDGTSPKKRMMISTDNSKTFYTHDFTGGPDVTVTWRGYQTIDRKNALGYYKVEILQDTEDFVNWTAGTVLMVKINIL